MKPGSSSQSEGTQSSIELGNAQAQRTALFGLVARRPCWVPTLRGWLLFLFGSTALLVGVVVGIHPFLAVNDPRPGGNLVIEGWASDSAFRRIIAEYERHPYERLLSTGGPLEKGSPLIGYETLAEVGAATFRKLRPDLREVYAVPAPQVRQDRTYASAMALKEWLRERGQLPAKINLVSGGPHSRRSRLLFQKAFGDDAEIGIIAMDDDTYDAKRWWTSSQGVRVVTSEIIAYVYARFFFWP